MNSYEYQVYLPIDKTHRQILSLTRLPAGRQVCHSATPAYPPDFCWSESEDHTKI